ncbi:hypothetical protein HRG_000554 [Hirsutella rhossiliensis]|uniref:WD40 repeat 2 n=1 Tax=Hirsutella rhossiliensis TaxID=111463 RepID=A0A9P8N7E1_9HYPO|nr:WD40 repeat 2 [Hirsutella rhossiliensis]KAH0967912.1 WD40 repeat 2 [Hirsutella rhossiliensis]
MNLDKCLRTMEGHADEVLGVSWTPDEKWVISVSADRGIQLRDPQTGNAQVLVRGHNNKVAWAASCPVGSFFATGSNDMKVVIWKYGPYDGPAVQVSAVPTAGWFAKIPESLKRPGFGLALSFLPSEMKRFPALIGDEDRDWTADLLHIRLSGDIKYTIPRFWMKSEGLFTCCSSQTVLCIDELQKKAFLYDRTGLIPVLDYSTCLIKSDSIVSDDLMNQLGAVVAPLEDVANGQNDGHPGSDGKVLDLVHPSLWPLVYGRSRILPDKVVSLQNCLEACDSGDILPRPDPREAWLPCDVSTDDQGHAKIGTYINNLHPVGHPEACSVLERFIERSLPAWDIIYRWNSEFRAQRLRTKSARPTCTTPEICGKTEICAPYNRPLEEVEPHRGEPGAGRESERHQLDMAWFDATHPLNIPDATIESEQSGQTDNQESCFFRLTPTLTSHTSPPFRILDR